MSLDDRWFDSAFSFAREDEAYYQRLVDLYELESCVKWIASNKFEKVCVQFPGSLLVDSVDVASYIERNIGRKVYILGDTAYGSCCVDEVGAKHVSGDCVIHFGHTCLSPAQIPVFYVFLKRNLDIPKFLNILQNHNDLPPPILLLYDVSYSHHLKELKRLLNERPALKKQICLPDLFIGKEADKGGSVCSTWCFLLSSELRHHCTTTLQRAYCPHPNGPFQSLVYVGPANANLYNFTYAFKDCKTYHFIDEMDSLEEVCRGCISKQLSYLVERIRAAHNIGIIVATLGVQGYREAVDHAKFLCSMTGKRSYILSIGKPSPTKLANFSEMDIFVAISCPESDFGDKKDYMQPIVGLYELDLALNKARPWGTGTTRDFREIIKGGTNTKGGGLRAAMLSMAGSFDSYSYMDGSWSLSSISTSSMPRLATFASMKATDVAQDRSTFTSKELETYNINKLIAEMNANRNAQSFVHQMKFVNKEEEAQMKAYQVTDKKPEKDAFEKHRFSDRKKEEFWAQHKDKQRNTTVVDRSALLNMYSEKKRRSRQSSDERDEKIELKLKEIETLSLEVAQLLQDGSSADQSWGGKEFVELSTDKANLDDELSEHALTHLIPRSVLDQLTRPSGSVISKEWKGLEQKLGEDEAAKLEKGRSGGPQSSYDSEPNSNHNIE